MKTLKINHLSLLLMMSLGTFAQDFEANLQLRPRYEYRHGYKTLMKDNENPASLISQRSRLNFNYKQENLKAKLTLQNVRTWGDVPTSTPADKNGIEIYEAWAEYDFNSKWSSRIGRQVLSYDNQRIMGEIDWAQAGQSHDALTVSFHPVNHKLDLGFALNNSSETLTETPYTINSYKAMQFAWYHTQFNKLGMSLLFLNTGYEYADTNEDLHVDYFQTFGTYLTYKNNKFDTNASLYGQTGKRTSNNVNAWNASLEVGYLFSEAWKTSLGYEFLSGKDQNHVDATVKSFNPVFGTNHAFNGYMDYFFVGNHQNSVGLQDLFGKLSYTKNKLKLSASPHIFLTAANIIKADNTKADSYLGTEVDLSFDYQFHKDIKISGGYSQMFGTETMEILKQGNAHRVNNWSWLMISVNPRLFAIKSVEKE